MRVAGRVSVKLCSLGIGGYELGIEAVVIPQWRCILAKCWSVHAFGYELLAWGMKRRFEKRQVSNSKDKMIYKIDAKVSKNRK